MGMINTILRDGDIDNSIYISPNEEYDKTKYHISAYTVYPEYKLLLRKHKFKRDILSDFKDQCLICNYYKENVYEN